MTGIINTWIMIMELDEPKWAEWTGTSWECQ